MNKFKSEDIALYVEHQAEAIIIEDEIKYLVCQYQDKPVKIEFDQILIALGRQANTDNFGLEDLQIPLRKNKTIERILLLMQSLMLVIDD